MTIFLGIFFILATIVLAGCSLGFITLAVEEKDGEWKFLLAVGFAILSAISFFTFDTLGKYHLSLTNKHNLLLTHQAQEIQQQVTMSPVQNKADDKATTNAQVDVAGYVDDAEKAELKRALGIATQALRDVDAIMSKKSNTSSIESK